MNKLIALFTPVLLATSLFVSPVSAIENSQLVNEQVVFANCDLKGGAAKDRCIAGFNGSDRN